MMDEPDGHGDLIADTEESLRAEEQRLAERRAALSATPGGKHELDRIDRHNGLVVDEDGNPGHEVEQDWPHEQIEFKGERMNVRKPQPQALAAFALASSKYVPQKVQTDMVSLFIKRHLSPSTHERVFARMMDPEDAEFDASTLGELMREIATLGTNRPTAPSRG